MSSRSIRLIQITTDRFVFDVLFTYFDESMASKRVYKPYRSWNTVGLTPI